jgi:hypothetical protein
VPDEIYTKRVNSRAIAGLHRVLKSTLLPDSERSEDGLCATALAGAAAPRARKTEYGNAMPFPASFSAEPAERPGERIHAGLCRLSVGRNHVGALHPLAARYPSLPIGVTGAKDLLPRSATGAAHVQLRLDRKWLTTPWICTWWGRLGILCCRRSAQA